MSRDAAFCPAVSVNGSTARAASRMRSSTTGTYGLRSASSSRRPQQHAELEEEELLEDQPHLRRAAKRVQRLTRSSSRRPESAPPEAPRRAPAVRSRAHDRRGQRIDDRRRVEIRSSAWRPACAGPWRSACRCARRSARCGRDAASRPVRRRSSLLRRRLVAFGVAIERRVPSARISYCGLVICRPWPVCSTLPKSATC